MRKDLLVKLNVGDYFKTQQDFKVTNAKLTEEVQYQPRPEKLQQWIMRIIAAISEYQNTAG